jgi:hypothetical protein
VMIIHRMCVAQACCAQCPIGKAAHRIALDCRQYINFFPAEAVNLAQRWEDEHDRSI